MLPPCPWAAAVSCRPRCRRRGGGRNRRHPRRAPRARLRPGHQAPLGALGGLHPRVRRRAQAPDAGSLQGARRRGHAGDHQRQRPPAPHHRRRPVRPGADIFNFQYNWPHLYQNAVVDVSDVANALAKAEGGFYEVWGPSCQVNGKWLSVPHSIVGDAVAYRKSWLKEAGATRIRRPGTTPASSSPASRRRASPTGRPSATPSATRRFSPTP